jgi:hypothetical protein
VAGIALAQINVFAGAINHPYGRSTAVARAVTVDVTRASIPLPPVATGSVEAGQQPSIALGGDAPELLRAASTEPVAV